MNAVDQQRTILVTGGSRGIGRAIVLTAVERGHQVLFTYHRDQTAADETVAAARQAHPAAAVSAYQLDVKDSSAVETLIDTLVNEHGQIHALVNNAGIIQDNPVALMTDAEWHDVIATNLHGSFYLTRALLMHFIPNRFGRVVNMLSLAAYGSSGQANYAASKAGLMGLTFTVAREYGQRNITSNAVMVGLVETDMVRNSAKNKQLHEIWHTFSPLRRLHTAEEMARAVLFLISDDASAINGEVINVTGGLSYVP